MNCRCMQTLARVCLSFGSLAVSGPQLQAQVIRAPSGRTLFNRASMIRSFAEVRRFSVEMPDGKFIRADQYITPVALVYGFYPKWTAIVVQP